MELDDFKNVGPKVEPVIVPGTVSNDNNERIGRIDLGLRKVLKAKRYIVITLVSMSVIYLGIAFRGTSNPGPFLIVTGLWAGAIYLSIRYRPLPDSIYLLPLSEFVKAADYRLRYFAVIDWLVVVPILIVMGVGGGIYLVSRLSLYTQKTWIIILVWVIFYIALCVFGFFVGRKDWSKNNRALLDDLQKLKESL
jgi:hypothetical protein